MQIEYYQIKKSTVKIIMFFLIVIPIFTLSYISSPYVAKIPIFSQLQIGVNALQGYPTYINGRMWRINQTNYIIWTEGRIINLETDHSIANFSICYAVTIRFNLNSLFLSFNQTALNYFHNETSCEFD